MLRLPIGLGHCKIIQALINDPWDCEYAPDELIFRQDTPANHALLIHEGRVEVALRAPGHESASDTSMRRAIVAHRGPGDLIGEMALVSGYRFADVRALQTVRARRVGFALIVQLVNARPDFALSLYSLATERLYEANRRLIEPE